jgi:large conductance mechanosensitive channel
MSASWVSQFGVVIAFSMLTCREDRKNIMLKDFKQFLLRGNVVDLAVAVVIGAAFTALVNAMVRDLITPLIAAVGGKRDFSGLYFTVHGSRFLYGDFINAVISFVILASVVFFCVVQPMNQMIKLANRRRAKEETPSEEADPQLLVLTQILDELKHRKAR